MQRSSFNASHFARAFASGCIASLLLTTTAAHASIQPDRTRVILNEGEQATTVTLSNRSERFPYLVQSWIEDEHHTKITTPLIVMPPLQRIEPNERNVLRIARLPSTTLPTDRESVFR